MNLQTYICRHSARTFAKALPTLKKRTGSIPFSKHSEDYGVAGNTFRAYAGWKLKPSLVFRDWAEAETERLTSKGNLKKNFSSRNNFLNWHSRAFSSLQKLWKKHQGQELSVAHAFKLIDLYTSWLSLHRFNDLRTAKLIERHANCPIDRQVLIKINLCHSNALPIFKPSMGHIQNKKAYDFCQDLIAAFTENLNGNRVLFDRFAYLRGN